MKRFLAFFLALVMLFAMVPVLGTTAKAESTTVAETVTEKPFYGLTWDTLALSQFGNLAYAPIITVEQTDGVVSLGGLSASAMKTKLDAFPEGMRYFRIFKTLNALKANAECVVYADDGVAQLKALMTAYIEEYYALGGKLDGIILDTEYTAMGSWYIYSDTYGGYYEPSAEKIEANGFNRNIYNDIVNHPNYATDIRPLLEERGFVFYDAVGGNKSEIWSMFPPQIWSSFSSAERTKFNTYYTNCYAIWNRVMSNRIAAYMTDAVYNPMAARYPNATVSDYTVTDSATWENYMSEGGGIGAMVGNADKAGNTSNENMYNAGPNSGFFVSDGVYQYNNIQSYNKAVYDDDAYNSFMFYVNRFKGVYAATDTKNISTWIAEYDYSGRDNSVKNSPYYTEYLYHVGLLDPKPFLVYMYLGSSKFTGTEGKTAYNERMQVISQALAELTKVAGYSDRKPIETPQSWNDGFILSGMYANGRNIWRLTPDTTDGTTLASFKKLGSAVAFSINGNTITFPQGTIIKDSTINTVGSCGYWIETPADVQPVITRVADRYAKYPSYQETFTYDDGTIFNSDNAKEVQAWEASADLLIESGALALTGTATLNNVKLPKNITAGDNYAKKQVWEVSITVPESMSSTSSNYVTLLSAGTNDGFKVQGNSVYYSKKGTTVVSYTKISDLTLTVGEKYTLRREMDFTANTCTYSVLDTSGNLLKQIADVAIEAFTLPVSTISMASNSMSTKVLVDDYKLYPTGVQQNIKFYDANTGVYQSATEQLTNSKVAYRFSWMNATNTATEAQVRVARYDSSGTLVSDTLLKTVEMQANWDGVDTGIVENTTGKVTVYLHTCDESNATLKDKVDGTCLTDGYTGDLVCNVCNEILTKGEVVPGTGHEEVVIAGKAATCTTDGLTEGKYCSACGETLVEQTVIPAGHTVVTVPGKAATCTEDGLTDGGECTACGEVLAVQTVIPATGHTEEILAGKAATCTEAGLTEGKTCTTCGEVLIAQTEISATGHKEAAPVQENVTTTSYERVVYCEYCGIELSRETVNVVTATVTLWGTEVTIDTDDSTADIPAAYYWTNGGEGAAPVAATADNWNYCFSIIDSIPTVTIRNADFTYAKSFLTATLDGKLKLAYEGTNNIIVPYSSSATYYFVKYAGATSAKGHLIVAGAENAVLNVTGGDNSASMLGVSNKAYLTISGGTFKIHKTKAGGVYSVIGAAYAKTVIENCTLDVKLVDGVGGKHPAVTVGYSGGSVTITNSKVNIETNAHTGLCAGVFQSNMKGVLYAAKLTIDGNSYVKVVADSNSTSDYAYNGVGIYASSMTVKSGYVEVEALKQAVYGTVTLTSYDGDYELFTEKDGEAVTEYTATTYFKVREACDHTNTTTAEEIVVAATCTTTGSKKITVTCACGELISETTEEIPTAGHTEKTTVETTDATCTEAGSKKTTVICEVCGETISETTEEIAALGHTAGDAVVENETDTSYDSVVYCATCGAELNRETIETACKHANTTTTEKVLVAETCTTAGSKTVTVTCADCGELISEETVEIPSASEAHVYDGVSDTDCNNCGTTRSADKFEVVGKKIVITEGKTIKKLTTLFVFYIGEDDAIDLYNFDYLRKLGIQNGLYQAGYRAFHGMAKVEAVRLQKEGNYVLFMQYTDMDGNNKYYAEQVSLRNLPLISAHEFKPTVDMRIAENTFQEMFVFYVGQETPTDLYTFSTLKTIGQKYPEAFGANGYKSYKYINTFNNTVTVPLEGNYVFLLKYLEPSGTVQYAAELITIHPKPVITLNGLKVAVDTRVDTNVVDRIQVFYVGDTAVNDMLSFSELKNIGLTYDVYASGYKSYEGANLAYAKVTETEGDYVVLIRYTDTFGTVRYTSARVTYTAS